MKNNLEKLDKVVKLQSDVLGLLQWEPSLCLKLCMKIMCYALVFMNLFEHPVYALYCVMCWAAYDYIMLIITSVQFTVKLYRKCCQFADKVLPNFEFIFLRSNLDKMLPDFHYNMLTITQTSSGWIGKKETLVLAYSEPSMLAKPSKESTWPFHSSYTNRYRPCSTKPRSTTAKPVSKSALIVSRGLTVWYSLVWGMK
jgi:hypothetical protein